MSEIDGNSRLSLDTVEPTSSVPIEPLTREPLEPNLDPVLEPGLDIPDLMDPEALDKTDGLEELKERCWLNIFGLAPPGHLLAMNGPEPLVDGLEPLSDGLDITSSFACTMMAAAGEELCCTHHNTSPHPHLRPGRL